jgi:hypothetical protein
VVDVTYNWHEKWWPGISIAFCVVINLVAALVGGANTFARETTSHLAFLGVQPVTRRQVWLGKLLVTFVSLVLLAGLSFGLCGGMLARRGYNGFAAFGLNRPGDLAACAVIAVGLFAAAVLWSTILRSAIGAAAAAVLTAGACVLTWWLLTTQYLPARWGPWLGLLPGFSAPVANAAALCGGAAALAASAYGFLRAPLLESRRRAGVTVVVFLALLLLGSLASLSLALCRGPHAPENLAEVLVDPSGRWITIQSSHVTSPNADAYGALWVMDTEGRHLRRLSRGPVVGHEWAPCGDRLVLGFGQEAAGHSGRAWNWLADPRRGPLRRLPALEHQQVGPPGESHLWSSRGTYLLARRDGSSFWVTDGRREILRVNHSLDSVLGWSPDEKTLYLSEAPPGFPAPSAGGTIPYFAVSLPGGEERVIAKLPDTIAPVGLTGDGRWIVANRWTSDQQGHEDRAGLLLIDTTSGAEHALGDLRTYPWEWSPDGRYLWCDDYRTFVPRRGLALVDTTRLAVVAKIGPEKVTGRWPYLPVVSVRGDLIYLPASSAASPHQSPRREMALYVAQVDGSGLRGLGPASSRFAGWTYDDQLIFWDGLKDTITSLDPATGEPTIIYSLATGDGAGNAPPAE